MVRVGMGRSLGLVIGTGVGCGCWGCRLGFAAGVEVSGLDRWGCWGLVYGLWYMVGGFV